MKYYLSVPCVGCPWVSKGLKGQLASLCTASLSLSLCIMPSLASISLLLILEDKGGPTHGHQNKEFALLDGSRHFLFYHL